MLHRMRTSNRPRPPASSQAPVRSRARRRAPAPRSASEAAGDFRVLLSTAPERRAAAIARALVASGAAACVNVVPRVRSVYRWRGRIEEGGEALLVAKTTATALAACLRALAAAHPYEVPEGLVLASARSLSGYARWVRETSGVQRMRHPRRDSGGSPVRGR